MLCYLIALNDQFSDESKKAIILEFLLLFFWCKDGNASSSFLRIKYEARSSVQFNHSVVSDSLKPHRLQHAKLSCPSPTPGAYSNSCPSRWWCHPIISSSVIPFSSCFQSCPVLGSFFQWVSSSHQVPRVLEFQLWHQSFQWIFRTDFL